MEEMVKERGVSSSAQLVCQLLDMFSKLCRGSYRVGGGWGWHGSRTEKIENHGCLNFVYPNHEISK